MGLCYGCGGNCFFLWYWCLTVLCCCLFCSTCTNVAEGAHSLSRPTWTVITNSWTSFVIMKNSLSKFEASQIWKKALKKLEPSKLRRPLNLPLHILPSFHILPFSHHHPSFTLTFTRLPVFEVALTSKFSHQMQKSLQKCQSPLQKSCPARAIFRGKLLIKSLCKRAQGRTKC